MELYKREGNAELPAFVVDEKLNDPKLYTPSHELKDAVNVALMLGQPLLVTGEPGTGKTQLAYHVAHFFGLGKPLIFNAQTTTKAMDLFYTYDALGHFQHNQNQKSTLNKSQIEEKFIHYNALGEAIRQNTRMVVLIDEIDKAPRDFPNDILFAIEQLSFQIKEIQRHFKAKNENRPIIIITSNSEKNLPDAFMRRVVYHHIQFPNSEELLYILSKRLDGIALTDMKRIVDHFYKIRNLHLKKPPSTAELIYWALLLQKINFPIVSLDNPTNYETRDQLLMTYAVLAKNKEDLAMLNAMD